MMAYELPNVDANGKTTASTTAIEQDGASSTSHRLADTEQLHTEKNADESVIARFGKKQQLKRRFKYLSSIGLTASLMLTWEVILFTMQFGLSNGGPGGLIYGYIAAWIGNIFQALVAAEIASMIPLAGGAFNWVAILSPSSCRKFLSYFTGWLTVICWQVFVAEVVFVCATLTQGLAILTHPEYEPQLWHATLIFYAIMLFGLFINTYLGRLLPRIEAFTLIFYVLGFFGVMIPLLCLAPKRSAADVFGTFQNLGGWSSMGLSFFVGWITSTSAFVGVDGADHIAEEIEHAAAVIPMSISFSAVFNGLLGFGILLTTLFVTQDFVAATDSDTGYPFMDIFATALGSTSSAAALVIVLTAINILSVSSTLATASRVLWAFARENGLPFSSYIVKVDQETRLPINAIIVTLGINVLLALISVGSTAAFEAFFSVALASYYSSFMIAAAVMLHKRLTTPENELPWGPFRLGRLGVPITIVAMIYTVISVFFSFWPQSTPISAEAMNYSSLLFGSAVLFSLGVWVFYGRRVYVGPIWELDQGYVRRN